MQRNNPYHQQGIDTRSNSQSPVHYQPEWAASPPKRRCGCCLLLFFLPVSLIILLAIWVFLVTPGRSNILVLGIDSRNESNLGRSDTIILTTIIPSEPYIGMLSIPRDLWVVIPGVGANRINTAHFFAEAQETGTGAQAVAETIQQNFGVDVNHYVRLQHLGFLELIDELDGIEVVIPKAMSGYEAGSHRLNGEQALSFVRDRAGSDDFSRMERGQIILTAVIKKLASPSGWSEIPMSWKTISQNLDTDIPVWKIPSIVLTIFRVGTSGLDSRIITRDMVIPFTSEGGASVLAPNWELINPILMDIFGQ